MRAKKLAGLELATVTAEESKRLVAAVNGEPAQDV
uniref:Uncharacterized protein n=1 Tax=Arundo donax TaxID=35708 RepID=A0A0A8YTW2_ARUDO